MVPVASTIADIRGLSTVEGRRGCAHRPALGRARPLPQPALLALILISAIAAPLHAQPRPSTSANLQILRREFPTIRFESGPDNPNVEWQRRELRKALQTVQRLLPPAIPLISGITLEQGNASYVAMGRANTWFIYIGNEHMDGTNEGTYGGQYARSVAATPTEYVLEHEVGHIVHHTVLAQVP